MFQMIPVLQGNPYRMVTLMKKTAVLFCSVLLFLTGCFYDPFSGQRPADYGEAKWSCDAYNIWFLVDFEKDDPSNPEGALTAGETTYFCKFYFIHQTNQLHISIYPPEYASLPDDARDRDAIVGSMEGECDFSETFFVYTVEKNTGHIFEEPIKKMTFLKTTSIE
jgi:hypothetical protein